MNDANRNAVSPCARAWSLTPLRPAAFVLTVAALLLAGGSVGCRNDEAANARSPAGSGSAGAAGAAGAGEGTDSPQGQAAVADALQSSKLSGLPPVVSQAIRDDVGPGRITQVTTASTEAGLLYRVSYIEKGTARIATYDGVGKRLVTAGSSATRPADAGPTSGPIRQRNGG